MALITIGPQGSKLDWDNWGKPITDAVNLLAGLLTPTPTATNADPTARTTTSASFTTTLSPANICGVAFTAPATGSILVMHNADLKSSSVSAFAAQGFDIKTGSVVGSGSTYLGSAFSTSLIAYSGAQINGAKVTRVNGLTPGTVYNVALTAMTSVAGTTTCTIQWREVNVIPLFS